MQDLARWLGGFAAAGAALLAAVWLIEAMPENPETALRACLARAEAMRAAAPTLADRAWLACHSAPPPGWDQALLLRGLVAALAALVLLMLAAMIPRHRPPVMPDALTLDALAARERIRHEAETGTRLSEWDSRERAIRRWRAEQDAARRDH